MYVRTIRGHAQSKSSGTQLTDHCSKMDMPSHNLWMSKKGNHSLDHTNSEAPAVGLPHTMDLDNFVEHRTLVIGKMMINHGMWGFPVFP